MGKKARNKRRPAKSQPNVLPNKEQDPNPAMDSGPSKNEQSLPEDLKVLKADITDFLKKSEEGLFSPEERTKISTALNSRVDELEEHQKNHQRNKDQLEALLEEKERLEVEKLTLLEKTSTMQAAINAKKGPYWTMNRVMAEFNERKKKFKVAEY